MVHPAGPNDPCIVSTDWEKDIEWAVLYSCNILGQSEEYPLMDPDPESREPNAWTRYWDDALMRGANENNCHGILSSSWVLWARYGYYNCIQSHMEKFCNAMKGNSSTVIDAYMDSALEISYKQWGAAALFHLDNVDDYLNNVTPDTDDPNMYYTWYTPYDDTPNEETWTWTLGTGGSGLPAGELVKVVCDVPAHRPELARLLVRKEPVQQMAFDSAGFDRSEFDNKGRVRLKKKKRPGQRGPIRLTRTEASARAVDFIAQRGGGMPADAELTAERQQMVATYDALDPVNTRNEYVRKMFFEYTHKFNGIEIASGGRGDSILAAIEGDEVVRLDRHWRSIVGSAGAPQQVIPASDALETAIENMPKVLLFPREGYSITEIRLFYYGLPSEEEEQYLSPAWGFQVNRALWVYVDGFTGEFLR